MMSVLGNDIAKAIFDESIAIAQDERFNITGYCEPFCGMMGVYKHIPSMYKAEGLRIQYKAGDFKVSGKDVEGCSKRVDTSN